MMVKLRRIILALAGVAALASAEMAQAGVAVPAGNRNAEQPAIPGASVRRTAALKSSFDRKYEKVRDLLASDRQLIAKIKKTAATYGIAPIHMVGALVGEHTYNVDAYDRLQSYYVKAASYTGNSFRFSYANESISDFLARPQFAGCRQSDSYSLWTCREGIWDKSFRGRAVDGTSFPDNRFSAVFFQPFFAGQTFGLGQINPLTALMLSDLVVRRSGYERLDEKDAAGVYRAIMDPDRSLAYMAAIIRRSIDDYNDIAGVDISTNPGITATLYNIGNPRERARRLAAQRAAGRQAWPEENYYGWLINDRLPELMKLL
ncbi:DUF1402 family protein [Rhizobiaceae bacterium BDR2-2]|uniref:DUF1402 family protein n=2 Tax=Ectorhizobium quercum TaxID=2965071 RepID=A0AAE3N4C4_9HYPH|nr:DUF1402 family protein [Ectorhizobium quercum]MCX8999449.1 DUF1402 family protein [Ectorhizobium quercum]